MLNIIGGIDRADSGQITIEGELMEKMTAKRLSQYRRKHLGYVFQMYNLIPNLTVRENIEVGAYLSDHALDVDELLDTLGLSAHQKKTAESALRRSAAKSRDRKGACVPPETSSDGRAIRGAG